MFLVFQKNIIVNFDN